MTISSPTPPSSDPGPAKHRRSGTGPLRLRHRHGGGESRLDQRELLCVAMADGDTGRRIGAQDQLAPAEMRSAGNRQIERVIFLYGSAAELFYPQEGNLVRAVRVADEGRQTVTTFVVQFHDQKSNPSAMKLRARTILWISDAPSTRRAWRA